MDSLHIAVIVGNQVQVVIAEYQRLDILDTLEYQGSVVLVDLVA